MFICGIQQKKNGRIVSLARSLSLNGCDGHITLDEVRSEASIKNRKALSMLMLAVAAHFLLRATLLAGYFHIIFRP